MSKQWGHGFYSGKQRVAEEIANQIGLKIKNENFLAIYLKQTGGKHCEFRCPLCGECGQLYKMTANIGNCEKCRSVFKNLEQEYKINPSFGVDYFDVIGIVEIDYDGLIDPIMSHVANVTRTRTGRPLRLLQKKEDAT